MQHTHTLECQISPFNVMHCLKMPDDKTLAVSGVFTVLAEFVEVGRHGPAASPHVDGRPADGARGGALAARDRHHGRQLVKKSLFFK